jgi:hypothetical protein
MNFNTRTVTDLIHLNSDLKRLMQNSIDEEFLLFDGDDRFTEETFAELLAPILKDHMKTFLKTGLKKMNLSFLKKMIDLNDVDYAEVVDYLTKN